MDCCEGMEGTLNRASCHPLIECGVARVSDVGRTDKPWGGMYKVAHVAQGGLDQALEF